MTEVELKPHEPLRIDGKQIIVRPVRSTDTVLTAEFMAGLSAEAKAYRFMGGVRQLSEEQLKNLSNVDYHHSMAYVGTVYENGKNHEIGVAMYYPDPNTGSHSMAVTIADEYRDTVLARELVEHLVGYARKHGVKTLYTVDLDDNVYLRRLAEKIGMSVRLDPNNAHKVIYSLSVDLHPERVTL